MSNEKTNYLSFEIDLNDPAGKETAVCINDISVNDFFVEYKYKNYIDYCKKSPEEAITGIEIEIEITEKTMTGTVYKFLKPTKKGPEFNDKVPSPPPTIIKFPPRK